MPILRVHAGRCRLWCLVDKHPRKQTLTETCYFISWLCQFLEFHVSLSLLTKLSDKWHGRWWLQLSNFLFFPRRCSVPEGKPLEVNGREEHFRSFNNLTIICLTVGMKWGTMIFQLQLTISWLSQERRCTTSVTQWVPQCCLWWLPPDLNTTRS